ncbi:MAG: TetR/AcrR family transcriptional regulator [Actinomycetota bacterium]
MDETILREVFEQLTERGYDQLRVDDVARRAGVSLSTIYRRWRTKGELAAAALRWGADDGAGTTDAPTALRAFLEPIAALLNQHPDFVPGLVVAMRTEPQLADALRDQLRRPDQDRIAADIAERIGTSSDDDVVRLLVDLGPAVLFTRSIIEDQPPTASDLEHIERLITIVISQLADTP